MAIIKNGTASKPATAPIIPSGTNITRTIKKESSTDNILTGSVKRNIPVFKNIEKIFKKTTTNTTINSTLSISILYLS
jgi:hypothetical protein